MSHSSFHIPTGPQHSFYKNTDHISEHSLRTRVITSAYQTQILPLPPPGSSRLHSHPHASGRLLGHHPPNIFSRSATSLPFRSFVIFIIVIGRVLPFSLSTLSLLLLFNTRFGHCSEMRKEKTAKFSLYPLVSVSNLYHFPEQQYTYRINLGSASHEHSWVPSAEILTN